MSKLEVKIKFFYWKVVHRGLPTGKRVLQFSGEVNCRRCGQLETLERIFWTDVTNRFWKIPMSGEIALHQFNEEKG